MTKRLRRRLAALLVCFTVGSAAPAYADAVTFWNNVTLREVVIGRAGPHGLFDIAIVQAAVHDAVQAFEHRFEPYKVNIPNAAGSPAAAVAAASRDLLVALYPARQAMIDADYTSFLQTNNLVGNAGLAVGQQAAKALYTEYRPIVAMDPFTGGTEPGEWRPTPSYQGNPPNPVPFAPMAFLYAGFTTPFTLNRSSQFRPQPPPPLTSDHYRRDYDEVKEFGGRFGSSRTAELTDLAYFWSENFISQLNRALRAIVEDPDNDIDNLGDSARLLALANLAMADAFITAWECKRHFNFWRPVTAIQEGDADGNPNTEGDPTWEPLVNTPAYPDYTSGANNVTGATMTILQNFFGTDDFEFTITSASPLVQDNSRDYTSFSQVMDEVVDARILLGIHFRFADDEARAQGSHVAHWVFQRFLRPLPPRRR
jgi:hypothetical protein